MKKNMLVEEIVIAVLLCVMVLMVCTQVLSRYVLHKSLSHTEELVRYMFVWMTFLGISAAAFRGRHLSVTLAGYIIPKNYLVLTKKISAVCALLFVALVIYYGSRIVFLQLTTHQTTAAMGMPMWIIGLSVPVCALVLLLRIIMRMGNRGEESGSTGLDAEDDIINGNIL